MLNSVGANDVEDFKHIVGIVSNFSLEYMAHIDISDNCFNRPLSHSIL